MQREAALAELAALRAREAVATARIEALEAQAHAARVALAGDPGAGVMTDRFLDALATQRSATLADRAALKKEVAGCQAEAARAVGRHDVLEKLAAREEPRRR